MKLTNNSKMDKSNFVQSLWFIKLSKFFRKPGPAEREDPVHHGPHHQQAHLPPEQPAQDVHPPHPVWGWQGQVLAEGGLSGKEKLLLFLNFVYNCGPWRLSRKWSRQFLDMKTAASRSWTICWALLIRGLLNVGMHWTTNTQTRTFTTGSCA